MGLKNQFYFDYCSHYFAPCVLQICRKLEVVQSLCGTFPNGWENNIKFCKTLKVLEFIP